MATCVTWKQPDANHFNGFCTNKFRLTTPPYDVRVDNGCDVCVKPGFEYGPCLTHCVSQRLPRNILINAGGLNESPHDDFSPNANITFYDKYPTAAEIGGSQTLAATSWVNGVNQDCVWSKRDFTNRWYRRIRTATTVGLNLTADDEFEFADIHVDPTTNPFSNPFSDCSPPQTTGNPTSIYRFCNRSSWGYEWRLHVTDAHALLTIDRVVARHVRVTISGYDQWEFAGTSFGSSVGPVRPRVSNCEGGGMMYQPCLTPLAQWIMSDPCNTRSPWRLDKQADLRDHFTSPDTIWNFPDFIDITF